MEEQYNDADIIEEGVEDYIYFDEDEMEHDSTTDKEVEYIDEIDADTDDDLLETHTPIVTTIESYHCEKCASDYATMQEFTAAHMSQPKATIKNELQIVKEDKHWERLDEVSVYEIEEQADAAFKPNKMKIKEEEFINETDQDGDDDIALLNEQQWEVVEMNAEHLQELEGVLEEDHQLDEQLNEDLDNDNNQFYCYDCKTVFEDLKSADSHDCPNDFDKDDDESEDFLKEKDEEVDAEYICAHCDGTYKTYHSLKRHVRICRYRQKSPEVLSDTEVESTTEYPHTCLHCLRTFGSQKALNSHSRIHKPKSDAANNNFFQQRVTCKICNTVFNSEKNYKLHIKIHDKRKKKSIEEALPAGAKMQYNELSQFFCEICNKSFDQTLLVVHKNMHQNVEEYICGKCNKQFENLPSYEMHMQLHADKSKERQFPPSRVAPGRPVFPCQYCDKEFPRPHEKVRHERVHTGEKPYECEVCGKTFRVSYSLTLHLRTHTDIRPYVCATCNKRFKSQPVYAHHLRTHLSERPYKCDVCPKTFRTSVQLCGHKNSHSKPFNCTECNRPFASLYAVKIHMKTHNKANKHSENLKHRCAICGAIYARLFALRCHIKDQHALEYVPDVDAAEPTDEVDDVDLEVEAATQQLTQHCFDHQHDTPDIMQNEEIIVDNFTEDLNTEEIVTDWLAK